MRFTRFPALLTFLAYVNAAAVPASSENTKRCDKYDGPKGEHNNYLKSEQMNIFWSNKEGFHAGWDYSKGIVQLRAGKSASGISVMAIAHQTQVNGVFVEATVKRFQLKDGTSCTAQVDVFPSTFHKAIYVEDSIQYPEE